MGLDMVEFVMEIEEEFGIQIPDEDGEKLQTLGDLALYVWRKQIPIVTGRAYERQRCPSQRLFYDIRKVAHGLDCLRSPRVAPGDDLADSVHRNKLKDFWRQISLTAECALPPIDTVTRGGVWRIISPFSTALIYVGVASLLSQIVVAPLTALVLKGRAPYLVAFLAGAFCATILGAWLNSLSKEERLPKGMRTFRDVVHIILAKRKEERSLPG